MIRNLGRLLCTGMLGVSAAQAVEVDLTASTSSEFSDNIERANADRQADLLQNFGLRVGLSETRKLVQFDADFDLQHDYYLENTFSDRTTLTSGFGLLNFGIVESFVDWRSSYTRSEVLASSIEVDNRDNRELRDTYVTGPVISYSYSDVGRLSLGGEYIVVELSDEDSSDSERALVNANVSHQVNSITTMTATTRYEELVDGDGAEEYTSVLLAAGFVREVAKGELSVNFGQTELEPETRDSFTGTYYDISFTKSEVLAHDISVTYFQDISDSSIGFDSETSSAEGELDDASQNDIVERTRFSASIERNALEFGYLVTVSTDEQDYSISTNSEESKILEMSFSHSIDTNWSFDYGFNYRETDFVDLPEIGTDKTYSYLVGTSYDLAQNILLSADLDYENRENGVAPLREYEELSLTLGIQWTLE